MQIQSVAQPQTSASGAQINQDSCDRYGAKLVSEFNGRYANITLAGLVFRSTLPSTTIVAANVSPVAATAAPIAALYNPINSGKNLVLLKHGLTSISGTPGGPVLWNFAVAQNVTLAAVSTNQVGAFMSATAGVGRAWVQTVPTGATLLAFFGVAKDITAVVVGSQINVTMDENAGDIVIPPGGLLAYAATAVGTTHIVQPSFVWAEVSV